MVFFFKIKASSQAPDGLILNVDKKNGHAYQEVYVHDCSRIVEKPVGGNRVSA